MLNRVFLFLMFFAMEKVGCVSIRNDDKDDKLIAVVTVFRHGDRAPAKSFPNDPYFNESYWPMGFGELTNAGKKRMYELGKWYRKRYASFLPDQYSPKDVYIRSTNPNRCLMSAGLVLAGLYPPKGSQVFDNELPWQPIPVNTMPVEDDAVLSMSKECPRFGNLLEKTLTSEFIENITEKYCDLFHYVSRHSGWEGIDVGDLATLKMNLDIYSSYNVSYIPAWAKPLDEQALSYIAGVNQRRYAQTPELKRLRTGPFWTNFLANFDSFVNDTAIATKFLMLSAHDMTLVALLDCMGVYDFVPPGFGAALIWELRLSSSGRYYVNLLYKRSDHEVATLRFERCGVDCDYEDFRKIVAPIAVDGSQWEKECKDIAYVNRANRPKAPFVT